MYEDAVSEIIEPPTNMTSMPEAPMSIPPEQLEDTYPQNQTPVNRLTPSDFEAEAFDILDNATNYDEGINQLKTLYNQGEYERQPNVDSLLSEYGNALRYKFKAPLYADEDLLTILPVKPESLTKEDTLDRINEWEESNVAALSQETDPDYIASKNQLLSQTHEYASRIRRSITGEYKEGLGSFVKDKFFRTAQGAVGPFASLVGADSVNDYLIERTQAERDNTVASKIAAIAGGIIPAVGAGLIGGPVGEAAFIGATVAQTAGSVKDIYEQSMESTGDQERAMTSAQMMAAAGVIGLVPLGNIAKNAASAAISKSATKAIEAAGKEILPTSATELLRNAIVAQKTNLGAYGLDVLGGAAAGTTAGMIDRAAQNVAFDKNGDITDGSMSDFLANAIVAGTFSTAHMFVEKAAIHQLTKTLDSYDTKLQEQLAAKTASKVANEKSGKPVAKKASDDDDTVFRYFDKDENGNLVPVVDKSVERQAHDEAVYEERRQEWINEAKEADDTVVTDDLGLPVHLKEQPDVEIPIEETVNPDTGEVTSDFSLAFPDRGILASEGGDKTVSGAAMLLANRLVGNVSLSKNILDGAFGVYIKKGANASIKVLRSLGADPLKFKETLAHEIFHAVRFHLQDLADGAGANSPELIKFFQNWAAFDGFLGRTWDEINFTQDLREASMAWRKGWDGNDGPEGTYNGYRSNKEEMFADAGSYLVNAPEKFKAEFPELYKNFENALATDAPLNDFWNQLERMRLDPNEISRFNLSTMREGRAKTGAIQSRAITQKVIENSIGRTLKRNVDTAYTTLFDKYMAAKQAIKSWPEHARSVSYDIINNLMRGGMVHSSVERMINDPLKKWLATTLGKKVDLNDLAHYEWANNLLKGTTETIENIRSNPDLYRKVADNLLGMMLNEKGIAENTASETGVRDILNVAKLSNPEDLVDALAKLQLIGDTAQILPKEDYLKNVNQKDDLAVKRAMKRRRLDIARLAKRKQSIPIENIIKKINDFDPSMLGDENFDGADVKDAMLEVLSPSAFSVRRYLVNAQGNTKFDASRDLSFLQEKLGPEKFGDIETASKEYHNILSSIWPTVRESGILTRAQLKRAELNSDTYVNTLVLRHFEGDESVSAAIRTAIGSLSETGNELTATPLKLTAIYERAYRQRAINSAINIAAAHSRFYDEAVAAKDVEGAAALEKAGPTLVEAIDHGRPNYDIFADRDKRSKADKKNSYLISYSDGKPTLYKINGSKGWEKMFEDVHAAPVADVLLNLTDQFSKMFMVRQFKTMFNPAFVMMSKFYDRQLEAVFLNSFSTLPGMGIHMPGSKGSKIDAQTRSEIKLFRETGQLTGNLKKVLDLDAAALDIGNANEAGENSGMSFYDAVYENFGETIPSEKSTLERIGMVAEKNFEKTFGKVFDAIGLGPKAARQDELRAKVNGFAIGKSLGMGDTEAAVFSREKFGIPDPTGGGTAAPLINKMFLFGRAHLNGLRVLTGLIKDHPTTAATQVAYRVLLPKLMVLPAVMGTALGAVLGKEQEDKYDLWYKAVPSNEKIAKNLIPLGWQDGKGQYHDFLDTKLSEVQPDWKPWYVRLPQSREMTSITKVIWPFLTSMFEGKPADAIAKSSEGAMSVVSGNFQPAVQYASNILAMVMGRNPQDFYRQKPILSNDLALAGSPLDKGVAYGKYMASSLYPAAVPYNPFVTSEAKGGLETTIQSVPFAGPFARSFIGISNYGNVEVGKASQLEKQKIQAGIRLSVDDDTRQILNQYSQSAATVSSLGKGWQQKLGPTVATKAKTLQAWHTKIWVPYQNELLAALSSGDSVRYQALLDALASSSKGVKGQVAALASGDLDVSSSAKK